ncbi:MAG TPA: phospho-sugar mutase, partial [Pirellulaceae bacterium]
HDQGVIDQVMATDQIARADFELALADGRIRDVTDEADAAYLAAVRTQAFPGPRQLRILYTPLHGVGTTAVMPALKNDGFTEVRVFPPHAEPDGDFPNIPGHVANPENPAVFQDVIAFAQTTGDELILASDPDCDRLGCAAPRSLDPNSPWQTLNGNQIAALLADYVLSQRRAAGSLSPSHFVVKTLVTTELVRRIADHYGVRTVGDLHVGFKWIGGAMDEYGPDKFVFGAEESHGYLVGQYARDKDGAVAAMLLAEAAASLRSVGKSLHQHLEALYARFGYFEEQLVNRQMPGSAGMAAMKACMTRIRETPPETIGGESVARVRDYQAQQTLLPGGNTVPLAGPPGDMVMIDFHDEGNGLALRPSGTEPKIKFYLFAYVPPDRIRDLEATRAHVSERLARWRKAVDLL